MPTEARVAEDRFLDLVREFPLRPLENESDLDRAVAMMDRLLDLGGGRRTRDEDDYLNTLGLIIHEYEQIHWPMPSDLEEREVLRRHHEAWLAANPDPHDDSNGAS